MFQICLYIYIIFVLLSHCIAILYIYQKELQSSVVLLLFVCFNNFILYSFIPRFLLFLFLQNFIAGNMVDHGRFVWLDVLSIYVFHICSIYIVVWSNHAGVCCFNVKCSTCMFWPRSTLIVYSIQNFNKWLYLYQREVLVHVDKVNSNVKKMTEAMTVPTNVWLYFKLHVTHIMTFNLVYSFVWHVFHIFVVNLLFLFTVELHYPFWNFWIFNFISITSNFPCGSGYRGIIIYILYSPLT